MSEFKPEVAENTESIAENYLHRIVEEDLKDQVYDRGICTRFPPEPNGYLHIGSVYAINISHTIAKKYNGHFNLRFDDTNPMKEDIEYVNAIIDDMRWMGFLEEDRIYFGSDYSETFYECAVKLIKKGKAYICDLSQEDMRTYRGTLTEAGKDSPYRERSVEENLDLFERMRKGEFEAGSRVLRAKIDMAASNINMRDPVIYRIMYEEHYRTGTEWVIYPMYDYAHPLQDAIEGITHSLCSIEFRNHRPLYEWVLEEVEWPQPPKQREFGRLNLTGVVTSKRYLKELVFGKFVDGWDDPRLSTIRGLRRRGFTAASIKNFIEASGISRDQSTVDISLLAHYLREDLKAQVPAIMTVLDPLKVVITNYPEGELEWLDVENNPENEAMGTRKVPFGRELYIEKEDFMEVPEKGFKRLIPNEEVRLKGAYFIRCNEIIKNEAGEPVELRCTYDVETKSGSGFTGRKVKGTIHWVSASAGVPVTVNLYDKLFEDDQISKNPDLTWDQKISPDSLVVLTNAIAEPFIKDAQKEDKFQFLRHGYFTIDSKHSTPDHIMLNRIVQLKDSWKKGK